MSMIAKMLSAAALASFVALASPSASLACDGHDGQAKQEKNKDDKVAQADQNANEKSKKKEQQAPSESKERQGAAAGSGTRTN